MAKLYSAKTIKLRTFDLKIKVKNIGDNMAVNILPKICQPAHVCQIYDFCPTVLKLHQNCDISTV